MHLTWLILGLLLLGGTSALRSLPNNNLSGLHTAQGFDAVVTLQGSIPRDELGNEVHAHGGQLWREGPTFFWVGTSRKELSAQVSSDINLYSSNDLLSWRFLGSIFYWRQIRGFPDRTPYGHLYQPPPPFRIERPKVLFHPRRRRYILYFHLDTPGFEVPAVGIAVSPNVTGPFEWVHHIFPDNNTSYDMTVYQDPADPGEAYLVRSCPVMRHAVSRLRPDWMDTTGTLCSTTGIGAEGPAVFKHGGRHYMFASHLTGWDPNPPILHESTAGGMCSTFWRLLPQPSHGPLAATTYDAQSTFIYEHTFEDGSPLHLWMGDRWNGQGPGGVGNASYVWLPLLPHVDGPGFELVWAEQWSLRQYKGAQWDVPAQEVRFARGPPDTASSDTIS